MFSTGLVVGVLDQRPQRVAGALERGEARRRRSRRAPCRRAAPAPPPASRPRRRPAPLPPSSIRPMQRVGADVRPAAGRPRSCRVSTTPAVPPARKPRMSASTERCASRGRESTNSTVQTGTRNVPRRIRFGTRIVSSVSAIATVTAAHARRRPPGSRATGAAAASREPPRVRAARRRSRRASIRRCSAGPPATVITPTG